MEDNEKKLIKISQRAGRLLIMLGCLCSLLSLAEVIFGPSMIYKISGLVLCMLFALFSVFSYLYTSCQAIEYDRKIISIKTWKRENRIYIDSINSIDVNVTNYNGRSILSWYFDIDGNDKIKVDIDYDIDSKEVKTLISDIQESNPCIKLSFSENTIKTSSFY